MPNVVITVAGTEVPKPGKKRGRIKDTQGLVYQISPVLLQMVNIGSSYDIAYVDDEYNGATFRVVESLAPAIGGNSSAQRFTPNVPQMVDAGAPQATAQMPNRDEVGVEIATQALAKEWIGRFPNPSTLNRVTLAHILRECRAAWLMHKKPDPMIESGNSGDFGDDDIR